MKTSGAKQGPAIIKALKALGLLGILGTIGATLLMAPLAGSSGCSDNTGGAGGNSGIGGAVGGLGGATGTGGAGAVDAGGDVHGDAAAASAAAAAAQIAIANMTFSPANLVVHPGGTVTVHNNDTMAHTVTSEAAIGNFTAGAVAGVQFSTGLIQPGGTVSFTIPTTAAIGTVIPYFCVVHTTTMNAPTQPTITVQ